ncbi:MAG: phosphoglycerate mutase [Ramlibacter sp.]|nr:phosphoglycerate mutase [Ramlibacter sp.]
MSDSTHLLIPFAACSSSASREALRALPLPHLEKLLSRLTATETDAGDDHSLSPPHERALARAYGLVPQDGLIPWAALQARQSRDGDEAGPWAWITPCHWQLGTDHITMLHPQALQLDAADAQALMDAMQPFFSQDGIALVYDAPTLWLARGAVFEGLPTASLDRVIGRAIGPWLPHGDPARALRRLQSEMQMLLYTHPVNEARERGGLLPVNSFWISGAGALPVDSRAPTPSLRVIHYLRDAALRDDWTAWADAWRQLDTGECARLLDALDAGQRVTLTLCGERSAQTFETLPRSLFRQISSKIARQPAYSLLDPL